MWRHLPASLAAMGLTVTRTKLEGLHVRMNDYNGRGGRNATREAKGDSEKKTALKTERGARKCGVGGRGRIKRWYAPFALVGRVNNVLVVDVLACWYRSRHRRLARDPWR